MFDTYQDAMLNSLNDAANAMADYQEKVVSSDMNPMLKVTIVLDIEKEIKKIQNSMRKYYNMA